MAAGAGEEEGVTTMPILTGIILPALALWAAIGVILYIIFM